MKTRRIPSLLLALAACGGGGPDAGAGGEGQGESSGSTTPAAGTVGSTGGEGGGGGAGGATTDHGAVHGPASSGTGGTGGTGGTVEPVEGAPVALLDYDILPEGLVVSAGVVKLGVRNEGKSTHNLAVREASGAVLAKTPDLAPGEAVTLTLELAPGSYLWFCDLPGHESLGMSGTLTAE